jgi:hypothetical protein
MTTHASLLACVLISATLGTSGCATDQAERNQGAVQGARDVRLDIEATDNQIDTTVASLNSLMSIDAAELQLAFDRYSNEVERMKPRAKRIGDDAADLRARSQAYLSDWQKQHAQLQDAELRRTSDQRRRAVMDRFQSIESSYEYARTSLDQFMRNLEDVRTMLRTDLSAHGVSAVAQTGAARDAQRNGLEVKNSLRKVQDGYAALAQALAPDTAEEREQYVGVAQK